MKTWAELISDLGEVGMTYAEIGSYTGCAGSTIGDLATGRSKSPRADAAIRLLKLHGERIQPANDDRQAA